MKVIAIVGPTGAGKTALGRVIAEKFNGVIISADSRQVYRGLDAATNKEGRPGRWQNQSAYFVDDIPQLLIDIAKPGGRFTLHDWLKLAQEAIKTITENGKLPIIVGGTGLYVTALLEGYSLGKTETKTRQSFDALILRLVVSRSELYRRSDERLAKIFPAVIEETKKLLAQGVAAEWLRAIGLDYRLAQTHIAGQLTYDQALQKTVLAHHAYIRRQDTWWRHHGQVVLVDSTAAALADVQQFLNSVVCANASKRKERASFI